MTLKLNQSELEQVRPELNQQGWVIDSSQRFISKSYKFKDFVEAFGWMAQAALAAEKLNHHPDWSNCYNRVDVALTTHDANGITMLDIKLAQIMDRI